MSLFALAKEMSHQKYDHYFPLYEGIFHPIRNEKLRLLEIGVCTGSSLRIWEQWLPNAEIIGIDINEDCLRHTSARSKVLIGSQADVGFLQSLGWFDIIIDDGGHRSHEQIISFSTLFPLLNPGGWYCIEDLHVAHGGRRLCQDQYKTVIELVSEMIHVLNWDSYPNKNELPPWQIAEMRLVDSLVAVKIA